jgi:agmatine/peptidylarginine deiminase
MEEIVFIIFIFAAPALYFWTHRKSKKSWLFELIYFLIVAVAGFFLLFGEEVFAERLQFVFLDDFLISDSEVMDESTLIVLSAPSIYNDYYSEQFDDIIEFQSRYAQLILDNGDQVMVLADEWTLPEIEADFPNGVMMEADVYDIWMRDFSTVNPLDPVQFVYAPAAQGGDAAAAVEVQDTFNAFVEPLGFEKKQSDLIMDGGNVVDNYEGRVVVTDRFLEDNNLTYEEGVTALKDLLGASEVAIVTNDDPEGLAHVDGMLMFIESNVIVMNDYSDDDPDYQAELREELETAFPGITLVEVPVDFDNTVWDPKFGSACNINVNALVSNNNIYLPVFGHANDEIVLELVRANTSKTVIPVEAGGVCYMGGSVRCLSWQVLGERSELFLHSLSEESS